MPKVNLKEELEILRKKVKQQQEVIDHYQTILFAQNQTPIQTATTNFNINDIEFKKKYDYITQLSNVWFLTLNADPKFIHFSDDDEAMRYYLWLIHETFQKNPIVGVFEHTKQGQVHAHFVVQEYNIGEKVSQLKQKLTARTWLNYSVLAKQITDSEGLKAYFIKENWITYNKNCINLEHLIETLSNNL